jgi:hypothetical protein
VKRQSLADLIAAASPYLATVPTAWLVGVSTMRFLGWPIPVAALTGLAVELLGIAVTVTALELRQHNQDKRKMDPKAPTRIAFALVGAYLGSVVTLTVMLDTLPQARKLAPLAFPLLSLSGMVCIGLRTDHARRVQAIKMAREERRALRANPREAVKSAVRERGAFQDFVELANKDHKVFTAAQVAERFKVSRRTAYYWIKKKGEQNERRA